VKIWAALDILGGKVVRLTQGKLETAIVYSADPIAVAKLWKDEGANGLHIVDLDAAFGLGHNRDVIYEMARAADGIDVQVGGGVRNEADLTGLFRAGAKRVIVGSLLIRDPAMFRAFCEKFPGRIIAGIDTRDREVRIAGWTEGSAVGLEDALLRAFALGARGAVVTDILRDGRMGGPNVDLLKEIIEYLPEGFELIASGGIASADDLVVLKVVGGVSGAVVGKSLYEGKIDLRNAVDRLNGRRRSKQPT